MTSANSVGALEGVNVGSTTGIMVPPARIRDVTGRQKMSAHQNIYEADFEYGTQPLRWESYTIGSATIAAVPQSGGVLLSVTAASGDIAIRQSRPYHRYQPGKTMFMATAVVFGGATTNNVNRIGFFDDGNGIFFEQAAATTANPSGIYCVYRSDYNNVPQDTRVSFENWTDPYGIKSSLDWTKIQMLFIEYAWYGAGGLRWGVFINGEPYVLHNVATGGSLSNPWCRTGNLPVRYENRNLAATGVVNTLYHWGVSVLVEGRVDPQRGFTYGYGMAPSTPRRAVTQSTTRFPILTIRPRVMGTQEFTQASAACTGGSTTTLVASSATWTVNQWQGRCVFLPGLGSSGQGLMGRIMSNTATTLNIVHNITGLALENAISGGQAYTIGLVDRGLILPQTLLVSSDNVAVVELIMSTVTSPITLTNASFVALNTLGSFQSFAERDVSSTALSGGEVVMAFTAPVGGSGLQQLDLTNLFPLYNTVRGNQPDFLTVAVTTTSGITANVGAHIICQEAMS